MDKEELLESFQTKCHEFFKWYSNFKNKDPIEYVEIVTVDIVCDNNCSFSPTERFSAVDIVIKRDDIQEIFDELGDVYKMEIKLKF